MSLYFVIRKNLSKITFLKKIYYFFRKKKSLSLCREEANLFLRKECKNVTGDILHVGSRTDYDKMGMFYEWYFKKCNNYQTLDINEPCDIKSDITNMKEIESESYDAILCPSVLEHIKSADKAIKEIERILKPGGALFFLLPTTLGFHGYPHDYWRFRIEDIIYILKNFSLTKIQSVGSFKEIKDISNIDKNLKWFSKHVFHKSDLPEGWVGIAVKNKKS